MFRILSHLLFWGCLFNLASCKTFKDNTTYFQPIDVVEQGLFTSGIEGPCFQKNEFINLPQGSVGNGIRVHPDGDLLVADYVGHNILKINILNKKVQVFAHNEDMNQPNDLAIHPNGFLYASDPNWKMSTGQLWLIRSDGATFCLEKNMGTTNGIEVSPDGKHLFVNESIQRKIWKYKIDKEGFISDKRLFHAFSDFGLDGMRCDRKGNLYVTRYGKGTVVCLNGSGKIVKEIQLKGSRPSNITFGIIPGTFLRARLV